MCDVVICRWVVDPNTFMRLIDLNILQMLQKSTKDCLLLICSHTNAGENASVIAATPQRLREIQIFIPISINDCPLCKHHLKADNGIYHLTTTSSDIRYSTSCGWSPNAHTSRAAAISAKI